MNVIDILNEKNIPYVQRGKDYITRCLNPEHPDHNPSLRIDKITGMFNCFSCGFSGDIFAHFGVKNIKHLDSKVQVLKDKITDLMWSKSIPIPLDAVYHSTEFRNIRGETYSKFKAFTTDSKDMGLEGRLVFPITNLDDNIICFQARYMYSDLEPKYKFYPNHAIVPLFPAKPEIINNSIILVEGFFDFLNLYDKGLTNAVCTFGTAFGSVKKQVKKKKNIDRLLPYKYQGVNTIYILYDGDESGRNAANNLKEYIDSKFTVEIIKLGNGVDPGSLTSSEVTELKKYLYE